MCERIIFNNNPPKNGKIALLLTRCAEKMFHKNGMRPLIIANGTKCYSILYCNSQSLHIRLKYTYSVISVIVDSLPGNTKKQGIDKFVVFGVRLVHSWADDMHTETFWRRETARRGLLANWV